MAKKRVNKAKPAVRKTTVVMSPIRGLASMLGNARTSYQGLRVSDKAKPHSRIEVIFRRKEFGKAPVEKHFVLHDGRRIESLYQLVDELETMSEDTFRQFVNEWKNDFATWTRDVFEAQPLADELQRVRDRVATQRAIMKHLLRDVAHVVSKQHVEHARKSVEQEQHAASQSKSKAVKVIIHEP